MSQYTQTINSLTSSRTDINQALSEKLEDTVNVKFSEMGDKIREIETKGGFILRIEFDNYNDYLNYSIGFKLHENTVDGVILLDINETKWAPTNTNIFEYSFETLADTVVIESGGNFNSFSGINVKVQFSGDKIITDIQGHKIITLSNVSASKADEIKVSIT